MTQFKPFTRRAVMHMGLASISIGSGAWVTNTAFAQAARRTRIPISANGQEAIARTRGRLQFAYEDQGLVFGAPIYMRLIKEQKRLEVWVQKSGRDFVRLRSYRVCGTSAPIGPRRNDAAPQQPEGLYSLNARSLRPSPVSYLGLDIGWPNAFDRALGLRGRASFLQAGCTGEPHFGLTDQDMEEVYTIVHGALASGQVSIGLHIFPFAMSALAMLGRNNGPNAAFWRQLAPAWQAFERTKKPPQVQVSGRRYRVIAG